MATNEWTFTPTRADDWRVIGFRPEWSRLNEDAGPNKSDRRALKHDAFLPVPDDYDKIIGHFGKVWGLARLNASQSPRVAMQNAQRELCDSDRWTRDGAMILAYNALAGVSSRRPATVRIHNLPDGTEHVGTDEPEYRRMFAAALVAMGVPEMVAVEKANNAKW